MKLLFWLVKNKKNSKGDIPIYCRITIDGKRTELFTGVYIKENEFDCKKKRIKGDHVQYLGLDKKNDYFAVK